MTDSIFDHLCGITAVILFIWSAVLLWASWQLGRLVRSLAAERRELRRWRRLQEISQGQNQKWQ